MLVVAVEFGAFHGDFDKATCCLLLAILAI
jgi:hypothetical protein